MNILKLISKIIPVRFNLGSHISTGNGTQSITNKTENISPHSYSEKELKFFQLRSSNGIYEIEECLYSKGHPCYRIHSERSDTSFVIPEVIFKELFEEKDLYV